MRRGIFAGVVALCLTATPGSALTADELWQGWQSSAAGMGLTLQAKELHRGKTLRLTDLSVAAIGDPLAAFTLKGALDLTSAEDGSVALVPAEALTLRPPPEVLGFSMELHSKDAALRFLPVQGWRSEVRAKGVTVAIGYQGAAFGDTASQLGTMNLKFSDLSGWLGSTPATDWTLDMDLAASLMHLEITDQDEDRGTSSREESDTEDVTLAGTLTVPASMKLERLDETGALLLAFRSGLGFDLTTTQGPMRSHGATETAAGSGDITYSLRPGRVHLALTPAGLAASAAFSGANWSALGPGLPVSPLTLSSDGYSFDLHLPLFATETSGDFHLALNSGNLALDAASWAGLDPDAVLPHDPLRLELATSGQLQLNPAIFADLPADDLPLRQFSLDLTRLLLRGAGAEINGTGTLASNPADPFGQPVGTARLTLGGINGLLDRLVELGKVAKDDLFPIRAGLAMFTDAVAGEDQLQSNLEARPDGSLWVNHQRVR